MSNIGEGAILAWQQSSTINPKFKQDLTASDLQYISKHSTNTSFQLLPWISSLLLKLFPTQKLPDPLLDLYEKTVQEKSKWQQIKQEEDLNTWREPFHFEQYNKIFVQPYPNKWKL